jgi:hypothetical protein
MREPDSGCSIGMASGIKPTKSCRLMLACMGREVGHSRPRTGRIPGGRGNAKMKPPGGVPWDLLGRRGAGLNRVFEGFEPRQRLVEHRLRV